MPLAHRRFTVDEYHRMADAGILDEDDRVELLDGEIVEMSPIGTGHAGCVNRLTRALVVAVGRAATVSVQNPVVLGTYEEPQPDVALLTYRDDGYGNQRVSARDVLFLVEVADTSVRRDRAVKLPLYARASVPEVWIVNLPDDVVEIHTAPRSGRYAERTVARRGDTLTPAALPGVTLAVEEILG